MGTFRGNDTQRMYGCGTQFSFVQQSKGESTSGVGGFQGLCPWTPLLICDSRNQWQKSNYLPHGSQEERDRDKDGGDLLFIPAQPTS